MAKRIEYVTCCEPCHLELHDGNYFGKYANSQIKHKATIELDNEEVADLVKRLEQLASECEQDEYTFVGNEGRKKISNVLQLYTIYEKNGKQYRKQAKSVDAMNNVLMLRDLPFRIEQRKERKRVNGKVKEFSIYIVIDKRKEN